MHHTEIERKFLVEAVRNPDKPYKVKHVEQVYLMSEPTVRLRTVDSGPIRLEIKTGHGMTREEYTVQELDQVQANELWRSCPYLIDKLRIVSGPWEIDYFGLALAGLVVAEIEDPPGVLPDLPPHLRLIREVTDDPRFENAAMARMNVGEQQKFVEEAYAISN